MNAIILERELAQLQDLVSMIESNCPQISICGRTTSLAQAIELSSNTIIDLVFSSADLEKTEKQQLLDAANRHHSKTILVADTVSQFNEAVRHKAAGCLLNPFLKEDLLQLVKSVTEDISKEALRNPKSPSFGHGREARFNPEEVIGIPTIEGYEFIPVSKIVRCEGLQKCTRLITVEKQDIISSYNIGEFRKQLEPYRFFLTHKSHLVNLLMIRTYHKDGTLIMVDGSIAPVSRRRRQDFLAAVKHL